MGVLISPRFSSLLIAITHLVNGAVINFKTSEACGEAINACVLKRELNCEIVCEELPSKEDLTKVKSEPALVYDNKLESNNPATEIPLILTHTPPAADTPPASIDTPPGTHTPPAADTPPASIDTPPAWVDTPLRGVSMLRRLQDVATEMLLPSSMIAIEGHTEPVIIQSEASFPGSSNCKRVCEDLRIRGCVLDEKVCVNEPLEFEERWKITHFCLANNGTLGGWAFHVPISVGVQPHRIQSINFKSKIFPATEPNHILTGQTVQLNVGWLIDPPPGDIIHHCAIENAEGVMVNANVTDTGDSDNSRVVAFDLGVPFPINSGLVVGNEFMLKITAPSALLSNGGPVPPPLDDTTLTLRHSLLVVNS